MSINDAENQILKIVKEMSHIASSHKTYLPRMIKSGWPGGPDDLWNGGAYLMYITFKHYHNGKDALDLNLDTDYTPVPWAAIPALINIAKSHFRSETERDGHVASDPVQRTISNDLAEDLSDTVPFLFFVDDWGEDDDLSIHCCNLDTWDDTMYFQNDLIDRLVGTKVNNEDIDCEMYIGTHDDEAMELSKAYDDYDEWKEDIINTLEEMEDDGYSPICIQMARDDDGDNCRIIYWIAKVADEEEEEDDD